AGGRPGRRGAAPRWPPDRGDAPTRRRPRRAPRWTGRGRWRRRWPPAHGRGGRGSPLGGGPEVDAQHQHAVVEARLRVADDGEVLEVELRLLQEGGSLLASDGRQPPVAHGRRTVAEPLEHGV